jgi:prepilin-type N-terminal cleavage/methylation domain-containing protein
MPPRSHGLLRHRSWSRKSLRAFTLIELAIVVLITSIFTAIAAPAFYDSLLFHRVESAARRVKADLDLARQQARLTSATQLITFAGAKYSLGSGVKSLDNPSAAYNVDLRLEPYFITSATANFSSLTAVSFDGYGTPSSGGTVVLTLKSHQCTITLNGTTGDTTITSNHSGGGTAQVVGN